MLALVVFLFLSQSFYAEYDCSELKNDRICKLEFSCKWNEESGTCQTDNLFKCDTPASSVSCTSGYVSVGFSKNGNIQYRMCYNASYHGYIGDPAPCSYYYWTGFNANCYQTYCSTYGTTNICLEANRNNEPCSSTNCGVCSVFDCASNGCAWSGSACNIKPCSSTNCGACSVADCPSDGCTWSGSTCDPATNLCSSTNCGACTVADCVSNGCTWSGSACEPATNLCSSTNCGACTVADCVSNGCTWSGSACDPATNPCSSTNCGACTVTDCASNDCTWSEGACSNHPTCTGSTCTNCDQTTCGTSTGGSSSCHWVAGGCEAAGSGGHTVRAPAVIALLFFLAVSILGSF